MTNKISVWLLAALVGMIYACEESRISVKGFKGVTIGMTVAEASEAYGSPLTGTPAPEDQGSCYYVGPGESAGPFSFMVYDGHIARIDIDGPGILTLAGIGVGSLESEVQKAYPGKVKVSPHPYSGPEYHYLTVNPQKGFAIIFETDGKKVTSYRTGKLPQVRWIEGCL